LASTIGVARGSTTSVAHESGSVYRDSADCRHCGAQDLVSLNPDLSHIGGRADAERAPEAARKHETMMPTSRPVTTDATLRLRDGLALAYLEVGHSMAWPFSTVTMIPPPVWNCSR